MQSVPGIEHRLQPLEEALRTLFIPALTGLDAPGDLERQLFAMPARYGGLGLTNPTSISVSEHQTSIRLTAHLLAAIVPRTQTK